MESPYVVSGGSFYVERYPGIEKSPHSTIHEVALYCAGVYPHKKTFISMFEAAVKTKHPVMDNLSDIKARLKYEPSASTNKANNLHNGQRKLLLSEVQFLTAISEKNIEFCIYAGAAPSNKGKLLADLFPNITFIFVDPNPFHLFLYGESDIKKANSDPNFKKKPVSHRDVGHADITHITHTSAMPQPKGNICVHNGKQNIPSKDWGDDLAKLVAKKEFRVYLIEELMTCTISEQFKSLAKRMAFITDARTNLDTSAPSDLDIVWNSSMMFNWVKTLDPVASCFKYRPPYGNGTSTFERDLKTHSFMNDDFELSKKFGIDFIKNYLADKWEFLAGETMIQVWAPSGSTETRHWTLRGAPVVIYSREEYDDKCNYFKSILRGKVYHENKHADLSIGFGYCNDCALECKIWEDYIAELRKRKISPIFKGVREYVRMCDILLNRPLKTTHNCGIKGFPITAEMLFKAFKWYESHQKSTPTNFKFNQSKALYTADAPVEGGGNYLTDSSDDSDEKMTITHTRNMKQPKEAKDSGRDILPIPLPGKESVCMPGAGGPDGLCSVGKTAGVLKREIIEAAPGCDGSAEECIPKAFEGCDDEVCAVVSLIEEKKITPEDAARDTANFKPSGPSYTDDLLNNYNIDTLLDKIANIMKDEKPYHMSFQMIDFQGVPDNLGGWKKVNGVRMTPTELAMINLHTDVYEEGYRTFFVVMNTDHRYNGGEHWFPIFVDFRNKQCTLEYFNSSGNVPKPEISAWLIKQHRMLSEAGHNPQIIKLTGIVHQLTTETECGVYSIYYIICRLKNIKPSIMNMRRIPDEYMLRFRRHLFNQSKWLESLPKKTYRPLYKKST